MEAVPKVSKVPDVPRSQGSLLDIFERQFAQAFSPQRLEHLEQARSAVEPRSVEPNPFQKQFGPCCKDDNARLYWCHKCGKTPGCWDCFIKHKCA